MNPNQESETSSQDRFARFADRYVNSQSHARGTDLDRLVEMANPQADWLVLDVATGGGHTALRFAPQVSRVVATDITQRMLRKAEKHLLDQGVENLAFGTVDAQQLPFRQGVFELVTCRIAPHHFPDPAAFIREGRRVLRAGGMLLVQDHVLPDDEETARYIDGFERLRDPSHKRAFSRKAWQGMFEAAGLTVVCMEEITKRHQLLPWAARQGCSPEILRHLERALREAPAPAADWLEIQELGTQIASFVNHHILIAGRAPVDGV